MTKTFSHLLEIHVELEDVFLMHAEALLVGQLTLSRQLLESYRELIELHMQHEERLLLPVYAEIGAHHRYPLVLYTGQHAKMRMMLGAISLALEPLHAADSVTRRAVLGVLDRETTFKHLCEHHDGSEREGLFAALDARAPAQAELSASSVWDDWWAAHARHRATLEAGHRL